MSEYDLYISLTNTSTKEEFKTIIANNSSLSEDIIQSLIVESYEGKNKGWLREWCAENYGYIDVSKIMDDEDSQNTILHKLAADEERDNIAIFKYLFENYVVSDIDAKNSRGYRPIELACRVCNMKSVKYLLERGAKPNKK